MIERLFKRTAPTFQYGRVAQIITGAGKIRVVTSAGADIWCDIIADIALGDTVVISGKAPRFVVQRAVGMLPATNTIRLV
jgi:hypothetical protein